MNRLLMTLMFVIALAISFVSLVQSDVSLSRESQDTSSWVSRITHQIFGHYKPSMGRITLAVTTLPVPPARKVMRQEIPKACEAGNANCIDLKNPSSENIAGKVEFAEKPNDSTKKIATGELHLTNQTDCIPCAMIHTFQIEVPKDTKDLQAEAKAIFDTLLPTYKEETAKVLKAPVVAKADTEEVVAEDCDQKDDDATGLTDLKLEFMSCEKKESTKKFNAKTCEWRAKSLSAKAKETCLFSNVKKYKIDSVNDQEAEAAANIRASLQKNYQAFLDSGNQNPAMKRKWDKLIENSVSDGDGWGAQMAFNAMSQHMLNTYGYNDLLQAKSLAATNTPQGLLAANQLIQNAAMKISSNPVGMANNYASDIKKFKDVAQLYKDNLPDGGATTNEITNAAAVNSIANPNAMLTQFNNLGTLVAKQLKAQGISAGTADTMLAGQTSANQVVAGALSAAGLGFCVGSDCVRGAEYRGNPLTGALGSNWQMPGSEIGDPGNPNMILNQAIRNVQNGGSPSGQISGNIPWAVGNRGTGSRPL